MRNAWAIARIGSRASCDPGGLRNPLFPVAHKVEVRRRHSMRMRGRWLAVAALLLLAGCASPPVWTPSVPQDAPAEGGPGDRTVTVHVTNASGPVPAAVILMWPRDPPNLQAEDTIVMQLLGLRTLNGTVVGHIPTNRDFYVIAGLGAAWTEEWRGPFGAGAQATAVDVRVYPRNLYFEMNGTWGPAAVGFDLWPYAEQAAWSPSPLTLDPDPETNQAMQTRIGGLDGRLLWENTATATADLGLMVASQGGGSVCYMQDEQRDLAPGPAQQTFVLPYFSDCVFILPEHIDHVTPPVEIGPATRSHLVAPFGLPYRIEMEVTLWESWGWQGLQKSLGNRTLQREWVDPDGPGPARVPESSVDPPRTATGSTSAQKAAPARESASATGSEPGPGGSQRARTDTQAAGVGLLVPLVLALALLAYRRRSGPSE